MNEKGTIPDEFIAELYLFFLFKYGIPYATADVKAARGGRRVENRLTARVLSLCTPWPTGVAIQLDT